ncbi:hypothetical protein R1flu_019766 [Riccia fluitans]|uniref:Uncharacterized protein n=1 Tax=Riccia fluitans TaxID=41844 RepID=A0ABD1ZJL6_9MARC
MAVVFGMHRVGPDYLHQISARQSKVMLSQYRSADLLTLGPEGSGSSPSPGRLLKDAPRSHPITGWLRKDRPDPGLESRACALAHAMDPRSLDSRRNGSV